MNKELKFNVIEAAVKWCVEPHLLTIRIIAELILGISIFQ